MSEGAHSSDGSWSANKDSPHRSLTTQEVIDIRKMAETVAVTADFFDGVNNASWDQHHPVAREVFIDRGVKPEGTE